MTDTKFQCGFYLVLFLLISIFFMSSMIFDRLTEGTATFTVTKTNIQGKSGRMLIFTEKETYQCEDSWAYMKIDSSDIFGRIIEGKTYKARVSGWRMNWPTRYKNIISLQEVQLNKKPTVKIGVPKIKVVEEDPNPYKTD